RWSEGRGPRGIRTSKARTGLRARVACQRRWSVYGDLCRYPPEAGAVCGKAARTDLGGGRAMKRTSLPLRNCVVGSGGLRLPCSTIAEHRVEGCDHFSHDGDDDLGFFVGVGEAIVEGFEGGTVSARAEGGHVEDITDRHPTTVDAAVSLKLAAVEVIGCEADEGGDLFAAHLPEFWQQGDEREGQHRADA